MLRHRLLPFAPCAVVIVLIVAQDAVARPRLRHCRRVCPCHAQAPAMADEIVGTWWHPATHMTEFGADGAELMFGKNGVLVCTAVDENGQRVPESSFGAQYKIVGDRLVCEPMQEADSKMPKIRIDGNSLEIQSEEEEDEETDRVARRTKTERFTRKTKSESVTAFLDGLKADLKASDRETRWRAVQGIRDVGPEAREAIPALREILKDRNFSFRQLALEALISIGPEEKAILPVVIERLNDRSDSHLADIAAQGLGKLGAKAKQAVPALIDLLRTGEESGQCSNQFHAAEALGKIGPDARAAIPALSEWMKDKSEAARRAATEAIRKIDSSAAGTLGPK